MSTRKKLLVALGVVMTVALLAWAMRPSPVPVSVAEVVRDDFAEYVEDEGRAQVRDPYQVAAPISGYLRRVLLEPGDEVEAGEVVFELESLPSPAMDTRTREQAGEAVSAAASRLQQTQAELAMRSAQRQVAESDFARQQELHDKGFVSQERVETSRGQRDALRASERWARHAVETARFELESARATLAIADGQRAPDSLPALGVRAPIAGTVINRYRCCEGPIAAGEVVMDIVDLATLEVRIDLLSMDAVRVRPGMRVVLERWGGEPLEGRVRRVEPRGFERISALGVEEQRVPVLVEIASPREQWQALGEGYRVEGRFMLWESADVLQVPSSALFREDERWWLYVVKQGRAERREVEVGRRAGLRTQIADGVDAGESIIIHPGDRIEHDVRVQAQTSR